MSYKPFDGEALIDAMAPLLQLRISPEKKVNCAGRNKSTGLSSPSCREVR